MGAPEASWRVTRAPQRRHLFTKINAYFAYPILDTILGAPGPLWGDILALQRPPGHSKMKSIVHFSSPMLRLSSLIFSYVCLSLHINISIGIGIDISIRILISVSLTININNNRGMHISINIGINIGIYISICTKTAPEGAIRRAIERATERSEGASE